MKRLITTFISLGLYFAAMANGLPRVVVLTDAETDVLAILVTFLLLYIISHLYRTRSREKEKKIQALANLKNRKKS